MATGKFLLLDPKNCLPGQFITSLLGRVCENPNRPVANYFPEDPSPFYSSAPFHVESRAISLLFGHGGSSVARGVVDEFISVEREKAKSSQASWLGDFARVFTLPQERQVLHNILENPELKAQTEKWLDEIGSLYMITGFVTVVNASCDIGNSDSSSVGFKTDISKSLEAAILALGGVPVTLPALAAEWRKQADKSADWNATYAGENIIAVQYRRLGRKATILSLVRKGAIKLEADRFTPGTSTHFGSDSDDEDESETEEIKEWKVYKKKGLGDGEKRDIVLSPGSGAELQPRDGNVVVSLG